MKIKNKLIISTLLLILISCGHQPLPLDYGYFRIDLPEAHYEEYKSDLPYTFDLSQYAQVKPANPDEPQWINIEYPQWHATIHCSYKKLNRQDLIQAIEETRTLVYKHTIKADAIAEEYFENPEHHVYGILYEIKGNAASSTQFFVTDSVRNFVRGSLYFNHLPNADSIAPVNTFITNDMRRIMESLTWK
ncbi:MAG TPA: gliding motility lipoprotein GldD [Paludibacteraceae bacterium]|jgi:gliding motility-associated lipoprotein GldD|nr:gliding motility lipoprotein GldD [Paludibacteraceae bacterium]HQB68775.1 gliding motility lipoprotein GldD [Paludibacteraceae bacterium]HRS67601.1 gliding motility lipoprotein GldD [Paludibacteraceae bacterium]